MALTINVDDLVVRVRKLADIETDDEANDFIPDATIIEWLNDGYRRLYDIICEEGADKYFVKTASLSSPWTLPSDFYRLVGVDHSDGTPLQPFAFRNRGRWNDMLYPQYRIKNTVLGFEPSEATPTVTLYYIPTPATLAAAGSFNSFNGWDEYLLYLAVLRVKQKSEEDTQEMKDELGIAENRVRRSAQRLNNNEPTAVADVEYRGKSWYYYNEHT